MARTTGVRARVLVVALLTGCGGASATTEGGSGSHNMDPEAEPITSGGVTSGGTGTATRTLTQAEFDAQWGGSGHGSTGPAIDFGGVPITGAPTGGPYAAYGGMGYDIEHPIAVCGTDESYVVVASHVCSDGSMPLGGAASAGAAARVGNVGANSTGHIIDLYAVPCASGPVQLFVDMYGCPGGGMPF